MLCTKFNYFNSEYVIRRNEDFILFLSFCDFTSTWGTATHASFALDLPALLSFKVVLSSVDKVEFRLLSCACSLLGSVDVLWFCAQVFAKMPCRVRRARHHVACHGRSRHCVYTMRDASTDSTVVFFARLYMAGAKQIVLRSL